MFRALIDDRNNYRDMLFFFLAALSSYHTGAPAVLCTGPRRLQRQATTLHTESPEQTAVGAAWVSRRRRRRRATPIKADW
jgi:hypothetical protein